MPSHVGFSQFCLVQRGHTARRLLLPEKTDRQWSEAKVLLRQLVQEDKETRRAVEVVITSIEEGGAEAADILQLCGSMLSSASKFDEGALRENVSELLSAFGISSKSADALLDSAGLRLLTWCLRPSLEVSRLQAPSTQIVSDPYKY